MLRLLATFVAAVLLSLPAAAGDRLTSEAIAERVLPPFALGPALDDHGLYSLLNSGGAEAGYVFETEPLAPLPGFSGAAINLLVIIDLEGRFLDVQLISQHEPVFVSGLGEAPFHNFLQQYAGLSISDTIVVGTPYGGGSGGGLTYLDGVTKATASVRIAHESLLAATRAVARERLQGVSSGPPARPDPTYEESLTWDELVDQGIARRLFLTNGEIDARFSGTKWANDDPEAQDYPDEPFLDLWAVDLGPPAIARAVLSDETLDDLGRFLEVTPDAEPILLVETGRHGLVSEDFVRNTAPDLISVAQDGLPIALRDADLFVELADGVPDILHDGVAMILRTDRRLGFDPTRDWVLQVDAVREHGMFHPEIGTETLELTHATPARFFLKQDTAAGQTMPVWREALFNRQNDVIALGVGSLALLAFFQFGRHRFSVVRNFDALRLAILAAMLGFVGWWGQGQLSIVTPLAALRSGDLGVMLYDPFSIVVWSAAIIGALLWGRALFCGWLCPFGALQEFADRIGRMLKLPQIEPSAIWDRRLKCLKYIVLVALVATVFVAPAQLEVAAEVEPFKTVITTSFQRALPYVLYAAFWLVLGMVLFKGFCRYVCPLGALMAIGGLFRSQDWIARRSECGNPCQLCKVRCRYNAIEASGKVNYSECFGCLDCVRIGADDKACVPLLLAAKKARRTAVTAGGPRLAEGVPAE